MIESLNFLSKEDICRLLAISPRGLGDMVSEKRFPRPLRIGKRCMWTEEAVTKWRQELGDKQTSDAAFRRRS